MNTAPATAASVSAADYAWASSALDELLREVIAEAAPPPPLSIIEWAEKYRVLSKEESEDYSGEYSLNMTPVLRGVLAALSDRNVRRVVVQKSAQLGYTAGVVCNVLGYHAHWKPCVQVVMFPREMSSKDFAAEKFDPMVKSTPVLSERIKLRSRSDGNSTTRKTYPGGRIKFVASKSPADVKSTSAKVIIVEEPDDTDKNVKGQGDSLALLRNRKKTVNESLELVGGTPTAEGASKIANEMRVTDQRRFFVRCHSCDEEHELDWDHVTIPGQNLTEEELRAEDIDERFPAREVYGRARWESAFYSCPHCGTIWSDQDRVRNIRAAAIQEPMFGWRATAQSPIPGFYACELQSVFPGSYIPILAERYLEAKHYYDRGEPEKMIDFHNGTLGRTWEYKGELPPEDSLRARSEKYAEWSCPAGGLVALMGVDVQHDRLAVCVWVYGVGEESWLAYWGELPGTTIVPHAGAWLELERLIKCSVTHASGAQISLAAVGIDSGDGQTSEAVYAFVRKHDTKMRPVVATKGASDKVGRVEIWTKPKPIDPNSRSTKASRHGVAVHIIGAAKAKDLILGFDTNAGRVRLVGNGPGRMHWYEGVRDDFFEQLLSEMKIPSRFDRYVRVWTERTDRRNEALDGTVICLYLARHLRLHLKRPEDWRRIENGLRQVSLLPIEEPASVHAHAQPAPALPPPAPTPTPRPQPARPAPALQVSDDWSSRL